MTSDKAAAKLDALYVYAERTEACDYCSAQPREQCRARNGRWRRNPHKVRMLAAEASIARSLAERKLNNVVGYLFLPSGKWKYEVKLDYTGLTEGELDEHGYSRLQHPDGSYLDAHDAAITALAMATAKGTSGVTINELGDYILVVPEPPNGFPIMVIGKEV